MSWRERLGRNWGRLGMRSEWITSTIDDICKLVTDGAHNSPKSVDNGYYMASVKDFTAYGFDFSNCRKISEADYLKLKKQGCVPESGDILVGKDGARYFEDVIIYRQKEQPALLSSIAILRVDDTKVTSEFLYYTLKSPAVKKDVRDNYGSGSAIPRIVLKDFKRMPISFPSLKEQKKITNICELLDEKIQLNNRINNNLLEQALTLYATHFSSVDKNGCIGDYCAVKSGFAFKSSWWTNNGVKVIKIGSINQDNLNLLECSYVDEDKADKAKDFVVKAGDLLIAMTGATIGKFSMVPYSSEVLLVNQRVGKFFLGNHPVKKLPFIYCTLKQPEVYNEVVNRGQGSAQPNISASDIMSIPCVIPSQDVINDFNDAAQPLFDLIISNQRENQQLSELRNTLLPKLMSGELDVSNIDL